MSILYGHPVLTPWSDDYGANSSFDLNADPKAVVNASLHEITMNVQYVLNSDVLERLIDDGAAAFASLVTSSYTMVRKLYWPDGGRSDQHRMVLDSRDFATDIVITPYVCGVREFVLPMTSEHNAEFRSASQDGFFLPTGTILAIGNGVAITGRSQSATSIIDIVPHRRIKAGTFDLDFEDNRIKIYVNRKESESIRVMRGGSTLAQAVLHPGLYLHAIVGALEELEYHPDAAWAHVLQGKLAELGYAETDHEVVRTRALPIAQQLMDGPFGRMVASFDQDKEE